jgi:hypothetical protein
MDKYEKTKTINADKNIKALLGLRKVKNLSFSKIKFNLFNFFFNRLFINMLVFLKNFAKKLCLLI